jgi:hypothetical protein
MNAMHEWHNLHLLSTLKYELDSSRTLNVGVPSDEMDLENNESGSFKPATKCNQRFEIKKNKKLSMCWPFYMSQYLAHPYRHVHQKRTCCPMELVGLSQMETDHIVPMMLETQGAGPAAVILDACLQHGHAVPRFLGKHIFVSLLVAFDQLMEARTQSHQGAPNHLQLVAAFC